MMLASFHTSEAGRPVAIVTAASKGMGAAIARELARKNWRLALLSRSESIFEIASELDATAIQGSTASPDDIRRLVEETERKFGRIDAVVNNTGHPQRGDLLLLEDHQWQAAFELVFLNVIRIARLATPVMKRSGGGAFLNVSSIASIRPDPAHPTSTTIRASLINFAKLFAQQYAADGLRMNNILPGRIESYPQSEERIRQIPAQRLGTVAEVATYCAFLVSAEASYINGQSVVIDGGLSTA